MVDVNDPTRTCWSKGGTVLHAARDPSDADASSYQLSCSSDSYVMTAARRDKLINEVLPEASRRIADMIHFSKQAGLVLPNFNEACYSKRNSNLPTDSLVGFDFVVYMRFQPAGANTGGTCKADQNGRHIAGIMNVLPVSNNINLILHEFLHAFGWSDALYKSSLSGVTWRKKPIIAASGTEVLRVARNHFNCPTLMGVEVEDGFDITQYDGTVRVHWDSYIMFEDLMTTWPFYFVSAITMALLQDTGHYIINYASPYIDQGIGIAWGVKEGEKRRV